MTWSSSWAAVADLLGGVYPDQVIDPYDLCARAAQAGVLTHDFSRESIVLWQLAPGVTRKHARAVLKALLLAAKASAS